MRMEFLGPRTQVWNVNQAEQTARVWELYFRYKSVFLCKDFLASFLPPAPPGMVENFLRKTFVETNYRYLHLHFAETIR